MGSSAPKQSEAEKLAEMEAIRIQKEEEIYAQDRKNRIEKESELIKQSKRGGAYNSLVQGTATGTSSGYGSVLTGGR